MARDLGKSNEQSHDWLTQTSINTLAGILATALIAFSGGGFVISRYLSSIEHRIGVIEHRLTSIEEFNGRGDRFTAKDGREHWRAIQRNEKALKDHMDFSDGKVQEYEHRLSWLEALMGIEKINGRSKP